MFGDPPRLTQFAPAPSGSESEYAAVTVLPLRITRIHQVGRLVAGPARPIRVPSVRVPLAS